MNLAEMLAMADQATQGVEVNTDFELLAPGTYDVAVTGAEGPIESSRTNPTNPSEHGQYLKIECTVTGPTCVGRKIWMNNNIIVFPKSTSAEDVKKCQTAMAMGAKERKVMLDSLGKTGISSAVELVGACFKANIVVEKGTNGYKDKNAIKSVKPSNSPSAPVASPSAPVAATATAQASRPKMPWER